MLSRRQFLQLCAITFIATLDNQLLFPMPTSSADGYQKIPVLLYHRIGYTENALTVTPERFAADLTYLASAGYQTISLELFTDFVLGREVRLPEKPMLITFDDGYRDNYQNAFPILQQHNMVASFFIITGIFSWEDRMTPPQILEMSRAGMSIGSHTVSHRPLASLGIDEARTEMQSSKETLENILGKRIAAIAYPQGSFSQDTVQAAKEMDYDCGFTTLSGHCTKDMPDFILRRVPVFRYDREVANAMAARG